MRNWKKWLAVALAVGAISTGSFMSTVTAQGYERWDTVAEEERMQEVPAAYATEGEEDNKEEEKPDPKAWKKINGVCYNGSGKPIPGAITRGIDVSEWQDKPNWKKVKNSDVDFAFIRISYGTGHLDKVYDYNMEQAEQAGLPVGTYVYSTATTTDQALAEAKLAIEKMNGYQVSYPVVFDLEYSQMGKLTKRQVSNLAKTFCEEVKKAGYFPMVYCNTNWYDNEIDWSILEGYEVWLARYGDKIQAPSHQDYSYGIWQCTDGDGGGTLNPTKGLIDGIDRSNNIDLNFGFKDYTKIVTPRKFTAASYKPAEHPEIDIHGNKWTEQKNGWVNEGDRTYYYEQNLMAKGWKEIEGRKYYFDPSTGVLHRSKLLTVDGEIYYVDEDGVRIMGQWITLGKNTYYMNKEEGRAAKGVKKVGKKYYRFNSQTGVLYKNKRVVDTKGNICYYGSDGARYTNGFYKIKIQGKIKTFYFDKKGYAVKGWITIDGKKYYFYKGTTINSGTRAENITLTDSKKVVSVFDKNGVCIKQYKKKK